MPESITTFLNPDILKKTWKPDLSAGISVAVVTIPQALAYASLAGLPPHLGLYASFLPTIVAAIFGTSSFLITGPTAMLALLTAASLSSLAEVGTATYITYALSLTVLVGLIQIGLGLFKMGNLINFVAHTVILGFTNAAAIIIILSQLPKLFGVSFATHHPGENLYQLLINYQDILIPSIFVGAIPLLFILIMKHFLPKFPAILISILFGILLSYSVAYSGPIVGTIPAGLPQLTLPTFDLTLFKTLAFSAFVIAIVSYMEGISIAKSLAAKSGSTVSPNRELLAQGVANLSASVSGTFPVAGSFSRSALNYSTGAKSYWAAIFSGLVVLLVLVFFTPLFYYLPIATLAAVIIAAVVNLINFHELWHLLQVRRREGIVAVSTFIATIYFAPHLDYGIMFGIVLSVIMYLHRSANPRIQVFHLEPGKKNYGEIHFSTYPNNHKILAISIDWSLTFANASHIEEVIINTIAQYPQTKYVIILGKNINHIDHSAEEVLGHLTHRLKSQGIQLLFTGIRPHVKDKLKHTHFFDFTYPDNIYNYASQALQDINSKEKTKKTNPK